MNIELRGFEFDLFMIISRHGCPMKMAYIKSTASYILGVTAADINSALDNLKEYIDKVEDEYSVSDKGGKYLKDYNQFGSEFLLNGRFDFTVMKFLYEMNGPVSYENFPELILNKTPEDGKGMGKPFHLRSYLEMASDDKEFYSVNNEYVELTEQGRFVYEQLITKEEKEKSELETETDLRIINLKSQNKILQLQIDDFQSNKTISGISLGVSFIAMLISFAVLIFK